MFKPLETTSLKDEFVIRMEELIFSAKLNPGDRLPPERELAHLFSVSRPVVHEGILVLESRGMVQMRPRHGVVVRDYRRNGTLELLLSLLNRPGHELNPELVSDLEYFRIQLERDMVRLVCASKKQFEDELEELALINREMSLFEDPDKIAGLDFRFHLVLALASDNAVYALLMNTLKPAHMHLLSRFYHMPDVLKRVTSYHKTMIKLLRIKDEPGLLSLIEAADSYNGYRGDRELL